MLTSILRTIIPALWGTLIAWAISLLPILEPLREELLEYGNVLVPIISALIVGAWYAFWRWLEPRLPDWVTRAVLGSAQTPIYPAQAIGGQIEDVGTQTYRPSSKTPGPHHRA